MALDAYDRGVGLLARRLAGHRRLERPDRLHDQLDHLERPRASVRGPARRRDHRPVPPRPSALERRLGLGSRGLGRLERHRRGDPGPPRRSRLGGLAGDPPRPRLPAPPPERGRRLRADERARLGRAVDGLGDPGLRRGRPAGRRRGVPLPPAPAAHERELPLQRDLRRHARLGHRAGASRARPQAVPAALARGDADAEAAARAP